MSSEQTAFNTEFSVRLREALQHARYDAEGVLEALGPQAHAALGREEPEPAYQASRDAGPLGTLIRLFLLHTSEPVEDVGIALHPLPVADALAEGLLQPDGDLVKAGLDIRPHADDEGSWWVVSDIDSHDGELSQDHVLGVGQASLSLVRATIRRPVDSLLDLGTGNGVQALHAGRHARHVVATDVSERSLRLARATFALNGLDVELLHGTWFQPVARRKFDHIVCNPPFVVGPAHIDYTYRDSGLEGDDASGLLVRQLPAFLTDGGVGQLLASWLHVTDEDWRTRVTQWLPPGTDAWFVQRDVSDPGQYVGTWLRDAGIDPASTEGRARTRTWLDWFAQHNVEGIGTGFITLRRTNAAPVVVCEDLRQAYTDPLGPEAAAWLDRVDWLRATDEAELLDTTFRVPDNVVLERLESPDEQGWTSTIRRLHRLDGPGWQHEVDEPTVSLLAGCRGQLALRELVSLLAAAQGTESAALEEAALPVVRELVRHGMLEVV